MNVQVVTLTATELNDLLVAASQKGAELALNATQKTWLSQKEACAYLGIDRSTLTDRTYTKKLPVYREGKNVRYLKSDLDLLMQGHHW